MGEEVREVVEGFNIGFCEGIRRGDAVAIAALYADDAVLLPPNRDMVRGRREIEKSGQQSSREDGKTWFWPRWSCLRAVTQHMQSALIL